MKVLVISGRTARQAWTHGAIVAAATGALVRKGHEVTLAAQSVDDPALFAGCAAMHAFDSFDQTATDWPLGFGAWAGRMRRKIEHDVCLSFSRAAGGDVWMPLEPSGAAWVTAAVRTLGVKSLAIALARHNGAIRAWASDAFFVAPPVDEDAPIRRVIAVGSIAAGEAARLLHRAKGLGERVARVDPFGMVSPLLSEEAGDLRERTRAMLGIEPDRAAALVSAPQPVGRLLDDLLRAVGDLGGGDPRCGPVVIAAAKDCFALHRRAACCGVAHRVRILGLTARMEAALAAADVVVLPARTDRGVFEQGGAARLGAEALAFGRPLVAGVGAVGYGLARLRSATEDSAGIVVESPSREAWGRALAQACDPAWLARASAAAREVGRPMTFERFAETLEALLAETARERSKDLGH